MFATTFFSWFMQSPKITHWKVAKMILNYIEGTLDCGLFYTHSEYCLFSGYTDNDYAGSLDDHKSTSRYFFHLGTNLISWTSKKQSKLSIPFAEEEYVASNSTACHAVWLRRLLEDLSNVQKEPTPTYCDNNLAISLSENHVFYKKSKYIDIYFHFIYHLVNDGDIVLAFCGSKDQRTDIFTNSLGKNVFEFQRG